MALIDVTSFRWLLGAIVILFPSGVASATTYYVSLGGNDANLGTATTSAWRTLDRVSNQIYKAGDRVLLQGGATFTGSVILKPTSTGTVSNPVVFSSYGSGRATVNAGSSTGFWAYNVGGVTISYINFKGSWSASAQSGSAGAGIYFYTDRGNGVRLPGFTINRCDISGFRDGGIVFGSYPSDGSQSGFSNVRITQCLVHHNGDGGIISYGHYAPAGLSKYAHDNVYIAWCKTYSNEGVTNIGAASGNGIVLGDVSNGLVENCVAYGNGWRNGYRYGGPVGIWAWDSTRVTFQYNESHDNGSGTKLDGDGFDLDGGATYCVMQYNYSHHNYGAGFLLYEYGDSRGHNANNVIRYNVSQNDAYGLPNYGGIVLGGDCQNNLFYNNTLYTTVSPAVNVFGGKGNLFANNIFFTDSSSVRTAIMGSSNALFLNNDYWTGGRSLNVSSKGVTCTSLQSIWNTGQEAYNGVRYGLFTDPLLAYAGGGGNAPDGYPYKMTAYTLQSASPLRDRGYDLRTLGYDIGTTNFYRLAVPPINIGAD